MAGRPQQFNVFFHFKTKSSCFDANLYSVLTYILRRPLPPAIKSTAQGMQLSSGALSMVWTHSAHQPCHLPPAQAGQRQGQAGQAVA